MVDILLKEMKKNNIITNIWQGYVMGGTIIISNLPRLKTTNLLFELEEITNPLFENVEVSVQ